MKQIFTGVENQNPFFLCHKLFLQSSCLQRSQSHIPELSNSLKPYLISFSVKPKFHRHLPSIILLIMLFIQILLYQLGVCFSFCSKQLLSLILFMTLSNAQLPNPLSSSFILCFWALALAFLNMSSSKLVLV